MMDCVYGSPSLGCSDFLFFDQLLTFVLLVEAPPALIQALVASPGLRMASEASKSHIRFWKQTGSGSQKNPDIAFRGFSYM